MNGNDDGDDDDCDEWTDDDDDHNHVDCLDDDDDDDDDGVKEIVVREGCGKKIMTMCGHAFHGSKTKMTSRR